MKGLLCFLIIGMLAGWCAGLLMKGRGLSLLGDMVIGMTGAVLGGWLFNLLGLTAYGFTGALIISLVGAVALLSLTVITKKI